MGNLVKQPKMIFEYHHWWLVEIYLIRLKSVLRRQVWTYLGNEVKWIILGHVTFKPRDVKFMSGQSDSLLLDIYHYHATKTEIQRYNNTRMHSSRMRTGRALTVVGGGVHHRRIFFWRGKKLKKEEKKFQTPPRKFQTPPRKFGADPPQNLEQTPPPPKKFGADTPPKFGADTPPKIWSRHPPENLEQTPPQNLEQTPPENLEQTPPPRKFQTPPPEDLEETPPPRGQNS